VSTRPQSRRGAAEGVGNEPEQHRCGGLGTLTDQRAHAFGPAPEPRRDDVEARGVERRIRGRERRTSDHQQRDRYDEHPDQQGGREQRRGHDVRDRADQDPRVQAAGANHPVGEPSCQQHSGERSQAAQEQDHGSAGLPERKAAAHEHQGERAHSREEEIADR
jgi:hypothetical protein